MEFLPSDYFHVYDVLGDNQCFFRSLVLGLISMTHPDKIETPFRLLMKKTFEQSRYDPSKFVGTNFEEEGASILKRKIHGWLKRNRDLKISSLGDISVFDLVETTHEIPFDDYFLDENLWGGVPEAIAFANLFNIQIHIFRPLTFQKNGLIKEGVILRSGKALKNVQYQLYQVIQPFKQQKPSPILNLLWKRYAKGDHYMALFPNMRSN